MSRKGKVRAMTFGEKLKEARKMAGLSQEELAERIGVSRAAVAKWETDKGLPDIGNLKAVAALLDVSVDYLLDDGTALDLSVTREAIDLGDAKGLIGKAKAKDRLVKEKFEGYEVYTLTAVKKLTKGQKARDHALTLFTSLLPGIGAFDSGSDIVNAVENVNSAFYLAENEEKQFFLIVSDEYMEIRQPAQRITDRKFEIGDFRLTRSKRPL